MAAEYETRTPRHEGPDYDLEVRAVIDAPPERVYQALTDPDDFAAWYGPIGFPVPRDTVEIDARIGGRMRFEMVGEADPAMRTAFDGTFTELVPGRVLAVDGRWDGIPGQPEGWDSGLRLELDDEAGRTRLVVWEGPHPEGTAELGRQAWEMMIPKLEALVTRGS